MLNYDLIRILFQEINFFILFTTEVVKYQLLLMKHYWLNFNIERLLYLYFIIDCFYGLWDHMGFSNTASYHFQNSWVQFRHVPWRGPLILLLFFYVDEFSNRINQCKYNFIKIIVATYFIHEKSNKKFGKIWEFF